MLCLVRVAAALALFAAPALTAGPVTPTSPVFGPEPLPVKAPAVSPPVWLIPPEGDPQGGLHLGADAAAVKINTSNNNLALKLHNGRLYFAFRSATHHHPKPPVWSPQFLARAPATTRLYVLSAAVEKAALAKDFAATVAGLQWRLEFEGNERLVATFLSRLEALFGEGRAAAETWWKETVGDEEAQAILAAAESRRKDRGTSAEKARAVLADRATVLDTFDLREPLFAVLNGELHFYYAQVEGKSMAFHPIHAWHAALGAGGWSAPDPVLTPKEHFWDIQVRPEDGREVAYLSSYSGAHYVVNADTSKNYVHFRRSTDGRDWRLVGGRPFVYQGGASEAAFLFAPREDKLWMLLRLDDGDERGWGALVGTAALREPAAWQLPTRADPRRFDSPRLFAQGDEIYLVARQNVCAGPSGQWDETANCPFDRAFVGRSEKDAQAAREGVFVKIQRKLLSFKETTAHADTNGVDLGSNPGVSLQYEYTYHFELPKRTALYRLDRASGRFQEVVTLPSSGDTAFPSIDRLGDDEVLVGNYSSPLGNAAWTWRDGQQNRTGIYLIKLTFPKPPLANAAIAAPGY